MLYPRFYVALASLLLAFYTSQTLSSEQSNRSKMVSDDEMVLDDLVVYGRQSADTSVFSLSDNELLGKDAWQLVSEALENFDRPSIGIDIDFAPASSVMTATGKEKINLVASAMKLIDDTIAFEVHVDAKLEREIKYREELALDRTRAIVAYLKDYKQIKNLLVIPSDDDSPLPNDHSVNVTFVNIGKSIVKQENEKSNKD